MFFDVVHMVVFGLARLRTEQPHILGMVRGQEITYLVLATVCACRAQVANPYKSQIHMASRNV